MPLPIASCIDLYEGCSIGFRRPVSNQSNADPAGAEPAGRTVLGRVCTRLPSLYLRNHQKHEYFGTRHGRHSSAGPDQPLEQPAENGL